MNHKYRVKWAKNIRAYFDRLLLAPVQSSNCEASNVPMLLNDVSKYSTDATLSSSTAAHDTLTTKCSSSTHVVAVSDLSSVLSCNDFDVSLSVSNVLYYIAGYVWSTLDFLSCTVCNRVLFMPSTDVVCDDQLFLHIKCFSHRQNPFGNLKVPSKKLMHCMKLMFSIFEQHVHGVLAKNGVIALLKGQLADDVPFDTIGLCSEHKDAALCRLAFVCTLAWTIALPLTSVCIFVDYSFVIINILLFYWCFVAMEELDNNKCMSRAMQIMKNAAIINGNRNAALHKENISGPRRSSRPRITPKRLSDSTNVRPALCRKVSITSGEVQCGYLACSV